MTESEEKERAITVTSGQILGLVLQGALVVQFSTSAISNGFRHDWGRVIIDIVFLAITLYYSFQQSYRIAEKLEK